MSFRVEQAAGHRRQPRSSASPSSAVAPQPQLSGACDYTAPTPPRVV